MLTDLGMFSEAISVLTDLLHGRRLPRQAMQSYKMVDSKSVRFDNLGIKHLLSVLSTAE